MADLTNPKIIKLKGVLFLFLGHQSSVLLLICETSLIVVIFHTIVISTANRSHHLIGLCDRTSSFDIVQRGFLRDCRSSITQSPPSRTRP